MKLIQLQFFQMAEMSNLPIQERLSWSETLYNDGRQLLYQKTSTGMSDGKQILLLALRHRMLALTIRKPQILPGRTSKFRRAIQVLSEKTQYAMHLGTAPTLQGNFSLHI